MKIELHNLGVIQQANIELKPMTVFIGPNNTGKTWVAYALAGLLGSHGLYQYISAYVAGEVGPAYPPLDTAIEQILEEGSAKIDMVQFANDYAEIYLNQIAQLAPAWLGSFIGGKRVSCKQLQAQFTLLDSRARLLSRLSSSSIDVSLAFGRSKSRGLVNALKEAGEPTLYFYTSEEGRLSGVLPEKAIREFIVRSILELIQKSIYTDTCVLPMERTSLITFPVFERKNKPIKIDEELLQAIKNKPIPMSSVAFLRMLLNIFESSHVEREEEAQTAPTVQIFMQLAQMLEQSVLGGKVELSTPEPDPQRELLFYPSQHGDVALDIAIVSSMVKELAPLVLYLRYLAEPGDLLVIDEPEMNLHPEAQVKMIELLALLVQAGLHVLITTHSPYMVDHLANLMQAARHDDQTSIKDKFLLQQSAAFIPQEQVAVYLFEQGTARNILDEAGHIDWGTFSNISDYVSQLLFEL